MMPEISIILPTYNGEKYIEESIESIIQQTFNDWELIIIDDCSNDATPELIDRYSLIDPRIRSFHNVKNLKLPASLNVGFSHATGEYLTWTSDDNKFYSDALQEMRDFLKNNPDSPMVCADMHIYNEDTHESKTSSGYDSLRMLLGNCVGACFLYRNQVRQDIGGYNVDYFCVEDYEYWLRILKNCGEISYINKTLYWYRFHSMSLTSTKQELIRKQLKKMYGEYIFWMISRAKNNENILIGLYGEFLKLQILPFSDIQNTFKNFIPLIEMDSTIPNKDKYYLFGAGFWGIWAKHQLSDKKVIFVDNDKNKVGTLIEGDNVISFADMQEDTETNDNFHIIVCADYRHQYEIIKQLIDSGISRYSVFQHLYQTISGYD